LCLRFGRQVEGASIGPAVAHSLVSNAPISRPSQPYLVPLTPQPTGSLDKLRAKISNNLHLGIGAFAKKGFDFVTATARSHFVFRDVNQLGVGVRVSGLAPKISNSGGRSFLGDDVIFDSKVTPIYLELTRDGVLRIGEQTYLNDGVWLGCTSAITIGARCLIGPGVRIFDNSYHGLYQRRVLPNARPVKIEDDVWIATNAIILGGVTIGRGAVVGANSVVSHDVAPYTIVAGSPAKPISALDAKIFEASQQLWSRRRSS